MFNDVEQLQCDNINYDVADLPHVEHEDLKLAVKFLMIWLKLTVIFLLLKLNFFQFSGKSISMSAVIQVKSKIVNSKQQIYIVNFIRSRFDAFERYRR